MHARNHKKWAEWHSRRPSRTTSESQKHTNLAVPRGGEPKITHPCTLCRDPSAPHIRTWEQHSPPTRGWCLRKCIPDMLERHSCSLGTTHPCAECPPESQKHTRTLPLLARRQAENKKPHPCTFQQGTLRRFWTARDAASGNPRRLNHMCIPDMRDLPSCTLGMKTNPQKHVHAS